MPRAQTLLPMGRLFQVCRQALKKPCRPHYRDEKYLTFGRDRGRADDGGDQEKANTKSKGVAQERNSEENGRVSGTARHILSWLSRSQYPASFGCNNLARALTDKQPSDHL
ncbi:uncharacterized protein TrAFT101_002856 [Trichoderma asperellum]|uniref:Uncharacterized protein n=1 Tax=Trichoderma asperellum (strain ATCC 204424 / CBS 433.97 / NBRC 101777) TaxID=1042311 RepID=A0A2T3ZHK2_TRIA4|nr:hypothetical protein M441DRAFT_24490 [Trichoderma asperellum CBS 433.97]PTB44295.1 hypothetical protein M441DRAFT_24490 [Trichoderma asperellum CBS 433.97]UKZ87043.1 hypothetical protein TrAFT101_002856 [Trichoderma asperellum]